MSRCTLRLRGLIGAGALLAGHLLLTAVLVWGTGGALAAVRAAGPPPPDATVALAAAVGAWLCLSWLTGVLLVAVVAAACAGLGSRLHARAVALAPAAGRRLVAALLGLTVAGSPVVTPLAAGATERTRLVATQPGSDHPTPADPAAGTSAALDRPAAGVPRGWTPDRPAPRRATGRAGAVRLVAPAPRPERAVADELVVRRGDSLWDIAARHLGPSASAVEIATEWPRWYAANRAVIGADPDLIRPGLRLSPPA